MLGEPQATATLWGAVILSGLYHGLNPGMGWPLAVSAALMKKNPKALASTLILLAAGHFFAMMAMLLPFSLMMTLIFWETEIRIGAGLILIALGIFLFAYDKHPRFLSRIKPSQIMLWSFLIATAHGAGLMLVPIYLGLCNTTGLDAGHQAAGTLMTSNILSAFGVSFVHTLAMFVSGAIFAIAIYYWVGLKFLSTGWFNMNRIWAASLILVGGISLTSLYLFPHM